MSDTPAGKIFDVALLCAVIASVVTIMLESVEELRSGHGTLFVTLEWIFTGLFTLEYITRVLVVRRRGRYVLSFFGLVDLVSILPAYIELLLPGGHFLIGVRVLRLMRIFRILKMAEYLGEASHLLNALRHSRRKIFLFIASVLPLVFVEGTIVYVLERDSNPQFANIPQSVYWAIVTITTVGYGDVAPITIAGKVMASIIMLTGFSIIAVPTGIVTSEITQEMQRTAGRRRTCRECGWEAHGQQARYCQQCGTELR